MANRPEFILGRIILFVAFLIECLILRVAVSRLSSVFYGSVAAIFSIPIGVYVDIAPIYIPTAVFILTLILNPTKYLVPFAERRIQFWSQYDYDIAKFEQYRIKKLRELWWRKSKRTANRVRF